MSFDWIAYLTLARELAEQGERPPRDEAKLRCALSRAYYAAFCAARNYLRDREGYNIPKDMVHWYVSNEFLMSAEPTRQQIGAYLNRMSLARKQADYEDVVPNVWSQTHYVIVMAEEVIDALRDLKRA